MRLTMMITNLTVCLQHINNKTIIIHTDGAAEVL